MKRLALALVLLLAACVTEPEAYSLSGRWMGKYMAGPEEYTIVMTLDEQAGTVSGFATIRAKGWTDFAEGANIVGTYTHPTVMLALNGAVDWRFDLTAISVDTLRGGTLELVRLP